MSSGNPTVLNQNNVAQNHCYGQTILFICLLSSYPCFTRIILLDAVGLHLQGFQELCSPLVEG